MADNPPSGGNWSQRTSPREEARERFHVAADKFQAEAQGNMSREGFRRYPCREIKRSFHAVSAHMVPGSRNIYKATMPGERAGRGFRYSLVALGQMISSLNSAGNGA